MTVIIERIREELASALSKTFTGNLATDSPLLIPEVTPVHQIQFGHYQCNNALKIAKELKIAPKAAAAAILEHIPETLQAILEKVEIAGPGFINMTMSAKFLSHELSSRFADPRLGVPLPKKKEKIIVEFSSPNVAKELHVGHLRSTIIGDSIARLFEFLGHDVLRLNHIGDFGTQFGMLITYLEEKHKEALAPTSKATLSELMQWYKESKKLFDEDSDFKKRAQRKVVALQSNEPSAHAAWKMICAISRDGFQQIYDLMDVKIIERGESFYGPFLADVVEDLEAKGLVTESQGAKCVFLEGFVTREGDPLPMIIQKSDGGYNYETTDMAALRHRVDIEKADRIICITDAGQALHFQLVFKAAEKAGYFDPKKVEVEHVTFGVVLGPDGKKFKTRSGETEKLIDLLNGAVDRAAEIIEERIPDVTQEEKKTLSLALGVGAVKYADLCCHRVKDYVFSYDRMLRFEGNTAAFLLYSFVRIQGIKRKSGKNIQALAQSPSIDINHPSEKALALHLCQLPEILEAMADDLLPSRLCEYLFTLAEKFNAFYRDCRVEGAEEENSRLLLCEVSGRILQLGLNLLGLKTVERM